MIGRYVPVITVLGTVPVCRATAAVAAASEHTRAPFARRIRGTANAEICHAGRERATTVAARAAVAAQAKRQD